MALPKAKADATEARLANLTLPSGGADWAQSARQDALSRLSAMGLPGARDEYWRFTRPDTLNSPAPEQAALFQNDEKPLFEEIERLKIVFRDGVLDRASSDDFELEGLEIETLGDATAKDIHWAKDVFGVLETRGQTPVHRPFGALNTAFATEGLVIRATGNVTKPVSLIYRHEDENSDAMLHLVIKVEQGASLTVLENGPAAARWNKSMEVEVADAGSFHHIRAQGRDHERVAVTHIFARIGAQSLFKSFTLTANGRMTRNEAFIEMAGDEGIAHIAGAALGDGTFHHDDTVFITHDAVACESRQVFKKVLRNGAVGTFQGKILVKEGAQKTDGYQISQSLLLDEDAQFLAKPELEIYADDVACSHGSTSGAIDEDALFYLRARGVPLKQAQDLLTLAFLAEAIEEIEDEAIADDIVERLDGWLSRRS
ncbi:MAG: SufD family Fe-S cluster assembly protein [Boseongicola sp.]|nr:SufD family Fe-S cluster assembly protein [Boseongicola sp.]